MYDVNEEDVELIKKQKEAYLLTLEDDEDGAKSGKKKDKTKDKKDKSNW